MMLVNLINNLARFEITYMKNAPFWG